MARHDHTIHSDHAHFGWNNALQPVLTVAPGQSVELHTVDSSGGQLPRNATATDLTKLDFARVNPVTGPVRIDGAEPGDAVKVTLPGLYYPLAVCRLSS